jgi:hypothetical protein
MRSFTGQLGTALSPLANVVLASAPRAAIRARECYFPPSSWVYAFILTCDGKLAVWFKRRRRRRKRRHRRHHRHHHRHRRVRQRSRHPAGGVPGVCCLFPAAGTAHYHLACAWHSPGGFVHRFLHRKMGYQLVAPPRLPCGPCDVVTAPCCPGPLSTTLHVSFTGGAGGAAALTWDGAGWVNMSVALCSGLASQVALRCVAGNWQLAISEVDPGACSANPGTPTSVSCSPLSVVFDVLGQGGCCALAPFTATVTT